MSFFADIIALAPTVFWKGDEVSGAVAADSSGNGRDGTYTGSVLLQNQPSLIINHPSSKSFHVDGTDVWVARNDEAALDPGASFTAICVVKATSLAAQRDIIGKLDSWQIWLETDGRMQAHISPAWTSFLSSNDAAGKLVINTTHLIGIRQDAGAAKASLWKDGVKVGEVTKSNALTNTALQLRMGGSSTGAGRSFVGYMQAFAYWATAALSDADMLALYNSMITSPTTPPTDPGVPDVTVFSASLVSATWEASDDPDGNPANITYAIEYWDGNSSTWVAIDDGIAALFYDWVPPSTLRGRDDVKLRVQALDEDEGISNWVESAEFTVPDIVPTNINVTPGEMTLIEWTLPPEVTAYAEYWDGLIWRTLFTDLAATSYLWDTRYRTGSGVKVRIQSKDTLAVFSAKVESAPFDLVGKYFGNIWRAFAVFNLAVLWKGNDSSGLLQDSSGQGRHATTSINITYGLSSIIYNRPAETSIRRVAAGGSGSNVLHAGGAWYTAIKTTIFFINPASAGWGGSGDALTQLVGRAFIHGNSGAGADHVALNLAGVGTTDLGSLTAGVTMVTMVTPGGAAQNVAVYFNNTNKYSAVQTTVSSVTELRFVAAGSIDSKYQGMAAFTDELDALNVGWLYTVSLNEPNDPPTVPGAFTDPDLDAEYDLEVPIVFGASTDPQLDAIEYYMEYYDPNEDEWVLLQDWNAVPATEWDSSAIVVGTGFKIRVKARDIYEEESDWRESDPFDIAHARAVPDTPAVEWVWEYDSFLGFKANAFSSPIGGATLRKVHWRLSDVADMSNIISSWTSEGGSALLGINPYDLVPGGGVENLAGDVDYWADAAFEDEIGNIGPRCGPVRAKTAIMAGFAVIARDSSGNDRHGVYGFTTGTDGASYLNLGPGSVGNRYPGHLLPGMPSTVRGFHTQLKQGKVRWQSSLDSPVGVEIPSAWNWAILVRVILDELGHPTYGTGLCGFRGPRNPDAPLTSPLFGNMRAYGTELWLEHANGAVAAHLASLVLHEPTTLKIVCKAISPDSRDAYELIHPEVVHYSGIQHSQIIYVNNINKRDTGWSLGNDTPFGPLYTGWLDIGGMGSPDILGVNSMWNGAILEFALWTHPEIDGSGASLNDSLTMPALYDLADLSPASIIASSPQLYYRLNDPTEPNKPTTVIG